MGYSDSFLMPRYKKYLGKDGKFSNIKVAWLGQQDPNDSNMKNVGMFYNLVNLFDGHCQHDFYDIENIKSWDVHDDWNIKGYDLVLCFRLTYLIQSSSHLIKQLKKTVERNGRVFCDFVSGNISNGIMSWNSNNLICFLPEYYDHTDQKLDYKVTDSDHLLDLSTLESLGLIIKNHTSFQGPKGRHYVIGEVSKI